METGVSHWLDELPGEPRVPALEGPLDVDVAVVGGGYAGLSTALVLREEGLSVAVLEAEHAGFGASGRNAGHLTPTIGKDVPTCLRLFGKERTGRLVSLADTAIRHTEAWIERFGIDCAYEPVGNVVVAVHERQHRAIDRAAEAAAELGLPGERLDAADLRKRGVPAAFTRGFLEPHGGILQPARYARGLRAAALAAGVQLFEGTPVTRIVPGPPPHVDTPAGRVRARQVVVTTNAWTQSLGWLPRRAMPLAVQLFATAPLDAAQREAVGWSGREGLYTAHEALESYRWTHDGRIVGGAKSVRYGGGGRVPADVDPAVSARLEAIFRDRFPELADLPIERHWGGPISMALDFLPLVGRRGEVLHAVSFAGHGLAMASYAGVMVRDLLFERDGPGRVLWDRRVWPLPPEPLSQVVFHAISGTLDWLDARVDRAVRSRAR
jgi:glycine/D-amino acid oxidase-like deaminating enzyme